MNIVGEYSAEMIKTILSMTVTGSIIALFLFSLKPMIKNKLPKSFQYYMWLAVVIALLLPVSKIIVIPVADYPVMQIASAVVSQSESEAAVRPVTYVPGIVVFIVWQLGMLLMLGVHGICYVSYVRKLKKHNICAEQQEIELLNHLLKGKGSLQLYKNPVVENPFLIGFFRPAVILPDKKYEDIRLQNILMHEIIHMQRHDIAVKWLLIFTGAVHWFNPLVYFVRREMNKACELACDESVIKNFNISEKQQYGDTLIAVAADSIGRTPHPITMFEDKENLKERLGAIMEYNRYSKRTIAAASVILAAVVCTVLGLGTLRITGSSHSYADNYSMPQDQMNMKEIELRDTLCNYDKKNIAEAYVFLNDSDGEVTNAYITIICQEKNPSAKMQSDIKSLAFEKLGIAAPDINIDYIDFESFTSNEEADK